MLQLLGDGGATGLPLLGVPAAVQLIHLRQSEVAQERKVLVLTESFSFLRKVDVLVEGDAF